MSDDTAILSWFNYDHLRQFTFIGWTPELANSLAASGFYSMGIPGQVVCCACDMTLLVTTQSAPLLSFNHRFGGSGCATFRLRLMTPSGPVPVMLGLRKGASFDVRRLLNKAELNDSEEKRLATFSVRDEVATYMAKTGFVNHKERRVVTCHYCRLELPNFGLRVPTVKELHEMFSPFCTYSTVHEGDTRLSRVYKHLTNDALFQQALAEQVDEVDATPANIDDLIASLSDN